MTFLVLALVLVLGLMAFAFVAFVVFISRNRTTEPQKAVSRGVSPLWALPVLAILASAATMMYAIVGRSVTTETPTQLTMTTHDRYLQYEIENQLTAAVPAQPKVEKPKPLDVALPAEHAADSGSSDGNHPVAARKPVAAKQPLADSTADNSSGLFRTDVDPAAGLPDWTRKSEVRGKNETILVTLKTQRWASIQEAETELRQLAVRAVNDEMARNYGYGSHTNSQITFNDVRPYVQPRINQEIPVTSGANNFTVHRIYSQLALHSTMREKLEPIWKRTIIEGRVVALCLLAGLATLVLGTTTGYLRLDARTGGAYRRRLKLAAVCLIVTAGLGVTVLIEGSSFSSSSQERMSPDVKQMPQRGKIGGGQGSPVKYYQVLD